jgi:hypothetical protein
VHDNPNSGGKSTPDSDFERRVARAEMQGEAWGQDVHARLKKHLPHWDPCPRVRLRLGLAARAGASRKNRHVHP